MCCFIYLRKALHVQLSFFLQKEASKSGNLKVTFMAEEKIKKLKKRNSELVSIAHQLEDKAKKLQEEKVTAQVCCSFYKMLPKMLVAKVMKCKIDVCKILFFEEMTLFYQSFEKPRFFFISFR